MEGSGDGEDVVKSSLVSEEDGRGLIPLCSCGDSMTGELELEGVSGGWDNGDDGRLDWSRGNLRGGATGDGLSGPSTRVDCLDREDLERAVKVCRLLGEINGWRGALPGREGPGDGGGFMEEVGLCGLADRDEGSVDLAEEVRVMLGAFLCPRTGLVAAEAGRWPRINIVSGSSDSLGGRTTYGWFRNDLDLARTDEHAMIGFAGEVLDTLYRSVVLAGGFVQFDSDPFTGGERGGAVETNETPAHGNFDNAPYHRLGHRRRPVVMEQASHLSITDREQ